jgi:replicative DNA helicase
VRPGAVVTVEPPADGAPPWEPSEERTGPRDVELTIEVNRARAIRGGSILDAPEVVESVWGDGQRCLWAKGEPFIMVGPDGVGKTSLAQQLALRRAGLRTGDFLGLPVEPRGRVLYLACDRPTQAIRSFRRMVTEDDRDQLDERLSVWRGPLPFDLAKNPLGLVLMARFYGAETVIVDSIKDVAADLSKEEAGLGLNNAFQYAVSEGIDVCGLHHQRKQQNGAGKPKHLADVYGSRWITAGAGSVVMLWGEAGDPVVDFDHLKQPSETVGPLKVIHDHMLGRSTIAEMTDAWTVVRGASQGVTAAGAATVMFSEPAPTRNSIEKARRQLESLHKRGKVHKRDGTAGGKSGGDAAVYFPLTLIEGGQG